MQMQRSFSLVTEDDPADDPKLLESDDEDEVLENFDIAKAASPNPKRLSRLGETSELKVLKSKNRTFSDSDSETEHNNKEQQSNNSSSVGTIPGQYDARLFDHLDVNDEAKEMFQYIAKYTPQAINLDHRFRPFVPEFLPAVGDIDAFLKVMPPGVLPSGEPFEQADAEHLGLRVLDEPAAHQSDSALLHLQLRAESVDPTHHRFDQAVVKKVDNVEKNVKTIDKWIKDITDLRKSKSSPTVRYSEAMPNLDDLMQEWPEDVEERLKQNGFPKPDEDQSLADYVKTVCEVFQIPAQNNKVHSLHLLFCLYAAVKGTQLFKDTSRA